MAVVRLSRRLWSEYVHQNRIKASRKAAENRLRRKRQALVEQHMPVARDIARQVWHRFRHAADGAMSSKITIEDMESAAYVGLVEAAGRWDPAKGDFAKYCYFRVRGAIIDAHRRQAYDELLPISLEGFVVDWADSSARLDHLAECLRDRSAGADEILAERQREALVVCVMERILPDEERDVLRLALAGAGVDAIGQALGRSGPWARAKLVAARDKVAAEVQRRAA